MVYDCATSLVSSELINIKHIEEKKMALSISTQDMMWHKLQVSMCATQHCCDAAALSPTIIQLKIFYYEISA